MACWCWSLPAGNLRLVVVVFEAHTRAPVAVNSNNFVVGIRAVYHTRPAAIIALDTRAVRTSSRSISSASSLARNDGFVEAGQAYLDTAAAERLHFVALLFLISGTRHMSA